MLEIRKELVVPGVAVLHLSGRIAVGRSCQEMEGQIDELIREKTFKVILDLTGVQRVDSTGFGTIVLYASKLKKGGGELRVAGAAGMVEEIAQSAHIPELVPFHATVEEAVSGIEQS